MQSLIKKKTKTIQTAAQSCCATSTSASAAATVAQCCAKVSKTVAGCHD